MAIDQLLVRCSDAMDRQLSFALEDAADIAAAASIPPGNEPRLSWQELKANLAQTMQRVCADHALLIIARHGQSLVVLLSLEQFKALEEPPLFCAPPAMPIA